MVSDFSDAITLTSWLRDRWQQPSTIAITLLLIFLTGVSLRFQYDLLGLTDNIKINYVYQEDLPSALKDFNVF
jgi:hypothetical protein